MRDRADARSQRLRLVVFTAGPLPPISRVLFERLATDPLLDLRAIIADEYRRPRKPLPLRVLRGLRAEGWPWLMFKLRFRLSSLFHRIILFVLARLHGRSARDEGYEALRRKTGVPTYRVADIHSESSLALIRSLRPQLGLIVGGRILRDAVISIPEYGTLNIHKKRVPHYRGGGPTGYWEILARESEIGVTIHYATSQVDAGPVLAEATILIEECDTLESLRIKADVLGAKLYHDTVRRFALGDRQGAPQDTSRGTTYRSPSEFSAYKLQKSLKQKATQLMRVGGARSSRRGRMRVLLQYAVVLPLLLSIRKRLTNYRGAPIDILLYPAVANRSMSQGSVLFEDFVEEVEFFRRHYEIISLDEAIERLRTGNNERVAFAITFHHAPEDNFWAVEYLQYLGVPASLFLPAGHVREGEEARHVLAAGARRPVSEGFVIGSHGTNPKRSGNLEPSNPIKTRGAEKVGNRAR